MSADATEVIVRAMELVEKATDVLVIMMNDDGHICWICTSEQTVVKLGMIETAKACILSNITK